MKRWFTLSLGIILGAVIMLGVVASRQADASTTVETEKVLAAMTLEGNASTALINYQGRLLDATTGQPKADGSYQMLFSIYSVANNGSPLWTETKSVTVNKALFSTLLGDTNALDQTIFNGQDLYLGITVGADPETSPRQRITHSAYAIFANKADSAALATHAIEADSATSANNAANADNLDNLDSTAFALSGHTHDGSTIVDGSITGTDIADESISSADLEPDAVVSSNIADLQVTTADLANGAVTSQKLAAGVVPKFISLQTEGAYLTTGATYSNGFGPNAGIHLADAANGSFYVGFTIPPDFTTGATLTARFLWHTSAASCQISFPGNAISVARPGRKHIVGQSTATGITVVGGTKLFVPATANQTNQTLVTIVTPDGVTPLQAGDSVIFSLFRSGTSTDDTCTADMVIQGISVTYS
ncbi:MAG: hypothetical protein U0175_38150 [Caldilineaceae bacterium]